MKIGLLKETKSPVDNRVALSPKQVAQLNSTYKDSQIVVQSSDIRAFSDDEYRKEGIEVVDNVNDCDILFGIKEVKISNLIPNKHYFFFGHIAKMQSYNRPLLQAILKNNLTFSDYEYLVDDKNRRLCAFGWWAGIVGVYYTLRGYGLKTKEFELLKPDLKFTLDILKAELKKTNLPALKILITGNGRVSQGAQYILNEIGAERLDESQYLSSSKVNKLSYFVADSDILVKEKQGKPFVEADFFANPQNYESDFYRFAIHADILLSCHFWSSKAPVYLTEDIMRDEKLHIKIVGDITCDICGSIKSTIRSSTHADPYYDYNPLTEKEEPAFSSDKNITVMAVDTCPNALAIDASCFFGEMLTKHVFIPLLEGRYTDVINRATIVKDGELTQAFQYLESFAKGV